MSNQEVNELLITCRECSADLSPMDDGYMTEHGTCSNCIDEYEEVNE